MKKILILFFVLIWLKTALAQTGNDLLKAVRNKLEKVNDYQANGKLKTNVAFIKAPVATVKIFYKRPDKMKIVNESGISFIPKGSVNINLNNFLAASGRYEVIDAGKETTSGYRILKLLPTDEQSDIVLSTLYIDEKSELIQRAKNTTRDNGTYELEMTYGQQAAYALPDKIIFSFNTKEYKLPKGVTFDYDTGTKSKADDRMKNKKGKVEITYTSYVVNKGIDDKIFNSEK